MPPGGGGGAGPGRRPRPAPAALDTRLGGVGGVSNCKSSFDPRCSKYLLGVLPVLKLLARKGVLLLLLFVMGGGGGALVGRGFCDGGGGGGAPGLTAALPWRDDDCLPEGAGLDVVEDVNDGVEFWKETKKN